MQLRRLRLGSLKQMQLQVAEPQVLHREPERVRRDLLHPEHLGVEAHGLLEVVRVDADVVEPGRPHGSDATPRASALPRRRSAVEIISRYRRNAFRSREPAPARLLGRGRRHGVVHPGGRAVHVSQPALSQQIRALEAEFGGELIERLPRGIRLTPAGRAFLPEARAAVLAAERAGVPRAAPSRCIRRSSRSRRCARSRSACSRPRSAASTTATPVCRSACTSSRTGSSSSRTAQRRRGHRRRAAAAADNRAGGTPRLGGVRRGCRPTGSARRRRWSRPGAACGPRRPALDPLSPGTRPLRAHRSRVRSCGIHPARCGADAAGRGGSSACGRWRRRRDRAR